jgi:ribosomal protein S19
MHHLTLDSDKTSAAEQPGNPRTHRRTSVMLPQLMGQVRVHNHRGRGNQSPAPRFRERRRKWLEGT